MHCSCHKAVPLTFTRVRDVRPPRKAYDTDAGIDFFVPSDFPATVVRPRESILIPSGIRVHIPEGKALVGFNKSGIAVKKRLVLGACVIDSGYEDEIFINLYNSGDSDVVVEPGEKAIAQFLLLDVPMTELYEVSLETYEENCKKGENCRGMGKFGSTDGK